MTTAKRLHPESDTDKAQSSVQKLKTLLAYHTLMTIINEEAKPRVWQKKLNPWAYHILMTTYEEANRKSLNHWSGVSLLTKLQCSLSSFSGCLPSFKVAYKVSRLLTKLQGCLPRQFQGCLPSFKDSFQVSRLLTKFQGCLPSFKAAYQDSFKAANQASRLITKL